MKCRILQILSIVLLLTAAANAAVKPVTPSSVNPAQQLKGTVLTEAKVRQVVAEWLKERTDGIGADIRLKSISYKGETVLPSGTMSFEIMAPREWEGWGRGALALVVRVNDEVVRNLPLTVEVEALADMVVTTRQLERGEAVTASDVAIRKRDLASAGGKILRDTSEVIGKRMKTSLRGNAPLRSDMVEKVPVIKAGQKVTLVAETSSFRVTASGRARTAGAEGDTIMVQNLDGQKDVPAVVIDADTVRVEF